MHLVARECSWLAFNLSFKIEEVGGGGFIITRWLFLLECHNSFGNYWMGFIPHYISLQKKKNRGNLSVASREYQMSTKKQLLCLQIQHKRNCIWLITSWHYNWGESPEISQKQRDASGEIPTLYRQSCFTELFPSLSKVFQSHFFLIILSCASEVGTQATTNVWSMQHQVNLLVPHAQHSCFWECGPFQKQSSSRWVSVTTLRYFSVLYDSHIFLFQALK